MIDEALEWPAVYALRCGVLVRVGCLLAVGESPGRLWQCACSRIKHWRARGRAKAASPRALDLACPLALLPSCPRALVPSCPRALSPSCPLALKSMTCGMFGESGVPSPHTKNQQPTTGNPQSKTSLRRPHIAAELMTQIGLELGVAPIAFGLVAAVVAVFPAFGEQVQWRVVVDCGAGYAEAQ
jgi:hypothetical protein